MHGVSPSEPASPNRARVFHVLATAHPQWQGLPIGLRPLSGEGEAVNVHYPVAMVVLARSGRGQRWYTRDGRTRLYRSAPRMLDLYGAGHHIDHARWDGVAGELVAVQVPRLAVSRLLRTDRSAFTLLTRHEVFDEALSQLVERLWAEAAAGSPRGSLYAQGLTLALIGLLVNRHGAGRAAPSRRAVPFSPAQRTRLRELMAAELAADLRIERLADTVGMSPDHFARVFKATFERTPHAYLLDLRIEAAARALRNERDRPVADIAGCCGFSSQAHFTNVFRRRLGTTPARWRHGG